MPPEIARKLEALQGIERRSTGRFSDRRVSQFFLGKVLIVLRTLSEMLLVAPLSKAEKEERGKGKTGKSPKKSGKSQQGPKKQKDKSQERLKNLLM